MFSCFSSWQGSVFSDFSLVLITLHHGTGMPLSDAHLYTFKKPGNVSPRTHWVLLILGHYFSQLQPFWVATQTGIPKHTCHPMVLFTTFIHRHNGLGPEACVCTRTLCSAPIRPLFTLGRFHLQAGSSLQWERGTVFQVFSQSLPWGNYISPC